MSMSSSLRKYIKFPGKIKLIYNWSILPPPSLLKTYTSSKTSTPSIPDSKVQLLYSGNIGSSHELSTILKSLSVFNLEQLRLRVLTSNTCQSILRASYPNLVSTGKLILEEFQADSDYSKTLLSATLGIVSLKPNSVGNVSPSKFQTYLPIPYLSSILVHPQTSLTLSKNMKLALL